MRAFQSIAFIILAIAGFVFMRQDPCPLPQFHEGGHAAYARMNRITIVSEERYRVLVIGPVPDEFYKSGYIAGFETWWWLYVIGIIIFNPRAGWILRRPYFLMGFIFGIMTAELFTPLIYNLDMLKITDGWNYNDFLVWELVKYIPVSAFTIFLRMIKYGKNDTPKG